MTENGGAEAGADWHPEDVKAAIRKTGINVSDLAVQNGLTAGAARKALTHRSARMQAIMAEHLGVPPQQIWPSRYDETGEPIDNRRFNKGKSGRAAGSCHRQNGVAA